MQTSAIYSSHDQLPAPEPCTVAPPVDYFYENTAKHLIKDTVRIMSNGLYIDLDKVAELEQILDTTLAQVQISLNSNPYIQQFQQLRYKNLVDKYIEDRKSKLRPLEYFLKPFKPSDMTHRSYFMEVYRTRKGIDTPNTDTLPTGVHKWPQHLITKLSSTYPLLSRFANKDNPIPSSHPIAIEAMKLLAKHKQTIYNRSYEDQIANPVIDLPEFNPGSSQQKQNLFKLLNIPSEATTKGGSPKWDRDQLERVHRETTDPLVKDLTQQLIDQSYAAIVRSNFIEAFYKYTVNDRLYGQYKLLGAKSGRFTSSNPNMLNMPSTGSIFAKPIKACFTAPEGFLVASIDYSALEDRVIANLSRDLNKLSLFTEGLDGHSLSATYYYPDRVRSIIGDFTDNKAASRKLKAIVDDKDHPQHEQAEKVRQDSKPISFGLAYGAFPKKVAATVKISIEEATAIFNAYHEELFPGITKYRENYVLPTGKSNGKIHLGLGFYIKTDDADLDIRTLNNATAQFWSILTPLTINKIHQLIDQAGYQDQIIVTSTIYDSIYFEVAKDPSIVKWLNDHLIPIMETDFMEGQIVHNSAELEIGPSWAKQHVLPHNASLSEITQLMESL